MSTDNAVIIETCAYMASRTPANKFQLYLELLGLYGKISHMENDACLDKAARFECLRALCEPGGRHRDPIWSRGHNPGHWCAFYIGVDPYDGRVKLFTMSPRNIGVENQYPIVPYLYGPGEPGWTVENLNVGSDIIITGHHFYDIVQNLFDQNWVSGMPVWLRMPRKVKDLFKESPEFKQRVKQEAAASVKRIFHGTETGEKEDVPPPPPLKVQKETLTSKSDVKPEQEQSESDTDSEFEEESDASLHLTYPPDPTPTSQTLNNGNL